MAFSFVLKMKSTDETTALANTSSCNCFQQPLTSGARHRTAHITFKDSRPDVKIGVWRKAKT